MLKITALLAALIGFHVQASATNSWHITVSELNSGPSEKLDVTVPVGTCYSKRMEKLDRKVTHLARYEHACVLKIKNQGLLFKGAIYDDKTCSMVYFQTLTTESPLFFVFGPMDRPFRLDASYVVSDRPILENSKPGANG